MKSAAIVVVCYNRTQPLLRLLDSLSSAYYYGRNDISLIFSIDFSGSDDVFKIAESFEWPHGEKIIKQYTENQGLKKHILLCGEYTKQFDMVVVLEDDLIVSDSFFSYAYQAVEKYWETDEVAGISLYNFQKNWLSWTLRFEPLKTEYDVFFMRIAQSWGQVWTEKKWTAFLEWLENNKEFKKDIALPYVLNDWPESSWLKYHTRYCIEMDKFFVYPYYALSTNCGNAGVHSLYGSTDYQVEMPVEKHNYMLPDFDVAIAKYDEYMNMLGLGKYLNIKDCDYVSDLYCTRKHLPNGTKYYLTTAKLRRPIVAQYSLSLRPLELSIIKGLKGEGIYLYDLTGAPMLKAQEIGYELMSYNIRTHNIKYLTRYTLATYMRAAKKGILFLRRMLNG